MGNKRRLQLSQKRLSRRKSCIIRRRMLKIAKSMQVDHNTKNESTDPLSSVGLPLDVTNFEIKTECLPIIKEEPMDNNEGKIETHNEEGVYSGNIEYCEDNKTLVFVNVREVDKTEECEEEGACNETIEDCEDNKDLVSINIDNVEKTNGYTKKGMHDQNIGHSESQKDSIINNTCSMNAFSTQENIPTRRSIVNFFFMWKEIHRIFNDHTRGIDCQFKYWNLVDLRRKGLLTEFFFKCQNCHYETSIWSEPVGTKTPGINAASITATDAAKIRFSQLKQFLTSMDIV